MRPGGGIFIQPSVSRLLLAVALILGVFGMHALASESCAGGVAHGMSYEHAGDEGMALVPAAHGHSVADVAVAMAVPLVDAPMTIVCVAVISLWLLFLRGRGDVRSRVGERPVRPKSLPRRPARDPPLLPSLSRLCVCRT